MKTKLKIQDKTKFLKHEKQKIEQYPSKTNQGKYDPKLKPDKFHHDQDHRKEI